MRPGLQIKVGGLIAATAAIAALAAGAMLRSAEESRHERRIAFEASVYTSMLEEIVGHMLEDREAGVENDEGLQELAERLSHLPDVSWLEVFDRAGRVVAQSDPSRVGQSPLAQHAEHVRQVLATGKSMAVDDPDGVLHIRFIPVRSPGRTGGAPLGVVEVVVDTSAAAGDFAVAWRNAAVVVSIALGTGLLVLYIALERGVLRPIRSLAKRAARLAAPNGPVEEDVETNELTALSRAITQSLESLEGRSKATEQKMQALAESSRDSIWETDLDSRPTFTNHQLERILGYTQEEMSEKRFIDLLHPEDRTELIRRFEEHVKNKTGWSSWVLHFLHKDGSSRYLESSAAPVVDAHGFLTGFHGIDRDVTARLQFQKELARSESRYRLLVDHSPYSICEIDIDGRTISINNTGLSMLGVADGSTIVNKPYRELVCLCDAERFDSYLDAAFDGHASEFVYCTTSERSFQLHLVPILDSSGTTERIMALATDVTESLAARRELEKAEAQQRRIVENMPVMVNAFDHEGRIALWNRECERVTGYSAQEIVGDPGAMELLYPDAEQRDRADAARLAEGHYYREWEWEITCKDGSKRTIAWSNISRRVPIRGWAMWGIGVDVTERARAETALRDSEETLRSVTESSPDTLMVIDLDGTIRFINRTAPGLEVEDVLGTSAYDYVPDHAQSSIRDCHRRVIETGRIEQFPYDYETPGGDVISYEVRLGPIYRDGEIAQLALASTDVTDRTRAEEQFRAQYKHFPVQTFTYQRQKGRFTLVDYNDAAYEATEGGIPKLLGKTVDELYADEPDIRHDFEQCFEERQTVRREYRHQSLMTEKVYDLDVTYVFVPPDLVMLHADDVGDRNAALEALEQSKKSLANAQRIANLGNWDWDIVTGKVTRSDEIYRIFGIEPSEFGANQEAFFEGVHPEDRQEVRAAMERSLHENEPYAIDHRVVRKDGEVRVVRTQSEITRNSEGRPIRMAGTVLDITEQRFAEQEIRRSLAEKETLLREIHHRVKNNLQVISSLLYLQSQKVDDRSATALFTEMQRRVESMAMIHESLYQSTDLSQVDFRSYLEMLSAGLASAHSDRRVRIETHVEDISLEIHIAMPCGLIVNELVTNALRHAFKEGDVGTVQIDFTKSHGGFRLSVGDDGVGLPADVDVAHSSTLGLRLVRSLAEQIGAQINIERDGGTTFQITFAG